MVTEGQGPSLLGRNWLGELRPDWKSTYPVRETDELKSGYQYSIVHRPGDELSNADGLSRLPLPTSLGETPQPYDTILLMERLNSSLVTAAQIRSWTERDVTLAKVRKFVLQGWPEGEVKEQMSPYTQRKDELSTRVVVPPQL